VKWLWLVLGLVWSTSALAASKEPLYVPAPGWVAPPAPDTPSTAAQGAPFQILVGETQARFGADVEEVYSRVKIKVLRPEALAVGNLTLQWNPATDDLRVHALRIHRDGQVIDVLRSQKFMVVQREQQLESAILDGALTGALQIDGLRVGDTLELISSMARRHQNRRSETAAAFPTMGMSGNYTVRVS